MCHCAGLYTLAQLQDHYQRATLKSGDEGAVGIGVLNFVLQQVVADGLIGLRPRAVWMFAGNLQPYCKQLTDAGKLQTWRYL